MALRRGFGRVLAGSGESSGWARVRQRGCWPGPDRTEEGRPMPGPSRDNAIDHVVAIMFENRSFDNLLGRLYQPGEVASFDGVAGREFSNPIPDWAAAVNTPSRDPGADYQHVNTQLFGLIDPAGTRGKAPAQMAAPYNAPANPGRPPTMDGFVTDYISTFMAEMGRQPGFDEYAQIMTGYTPPPLPGRS